MKKFCRSLVLFLIILLFRAIPSFGDNVIFIFELTDPNDSPLPFVEVEITQNGVPDQQLLFQTDDLGRIVESLPQDNDYEYKVSYGDWSSGSFSTKDVTTFLWIKLDYRQATISLLDANGDPMSDESVQMYKINDDGTEMPCSVKKTDENGVVSFVLPDKGKYKYIALDQQETFIMDGSLNKSVSALSGYTLMPIYFGFKKGTEIINVSAEDIKVYKKNTNGNYSIYGASPSNDAPGEAGYSIFESPVSCLPGGQYKAEVSTSEYGSLSVEFTAYLNSEMKDTIYFIIPVEDEGEGGGQGGGGGNQGGEGGVPEKCKLTVKTVWKDDEEPIPDVPFLVNNGQWATDILGSRTFEINKKSSQRIEVLNLSETHFITQDTTIILYLDDFYRTNFIFRLSGEEVSTPSISVICAQSISMNMCTQRSFACKPKQYCPILTLPGDYTYSFSIKDFHYDALMSSTFDIPVVPKESRGKDTTIYFDLVKKNEVKFIVLDDDGDPFPYIPAGIFKYDGGVLSSGSSFDYSSHSELETDSLGTFTDYLLDGDYRIAVMDTIFDFSIESDTTIILQSIKEKKNVYFKFLLDGKEVFPQVMRIDLFYPDSSDYVYIVSTIEKDEDGNDYRFFDKPAKCFAGKYIYSFELRDMGFNGRKSDSFEAFISAKQDTIVFIVLPVKPKVEIIVVDKERKPIQNVYGAIYRYNSDGSLDPDPLYDDFSHDELKTDDAGTIWDRLMPGKYRFVIDGIVQRDFVVGEYDIKFEVMAGVDYFTTTFIVKDTKGNPVKNTFLEIKKEGDFYGSNLTDENGEMEIMNESGTYTYYLHYGDVRDSTYHIYKSDTTIYIIVPELVYAESIDIKGCKCLQPGESIQLFSEITPSDATYSDVKWSIDNQLYANISSNGILTANEVGLEGTVIITATAKDGSDIPPVTKEIKILKSCEDYKIGFSIGKVGVTDTTISGGTLSLILDAVGDKVENPVGWYVYQYSTDSIAWHNINANPVQESSFVLDSKDYDLDETVYFRAIAAETAEIARKVSGGDLSGACLSYGISTPVKCKVVGIFQNWPDNVCSSDAEVTLNLSSESLAIIEQAGTVVEWYRKVDESTGFVKMNVPQEKWLNPTFTLTESAVFKVKVINTSEKFDAEFEQKIDYLSAPDFKIYASQDVVCEGASVELSIDNSIPANSYKWFDGSGQPTNTVLAGKEGYWAVLKACPLDTAKILLTIDDSIKISLIADRDLICSTETDPVELQVQVNQGMPGMYVWSPNSSDNTPSVSVFPGQTTEYKVTVRTVLDKCPAAVDSVTIVVEPAIELSLSASNYSICQDDTQSITLTATTQSGTPAEYIWWDGTVTSEPVRDVIPVENMVYSAQAKGAACPLSTVVYSDEVKVAVHTPVSLSVETPVVNFGEPVRLEAIVDKPVTGPYHWYGVENGNEILLGETDTPVFEHFLSKAMSYMVKAENGICPLNASVQAEVKMVDRTKIPTVFTPYDRDGMNDDFMPGYKVFIYDRYGDLICHSENGWDGTYRGKTADAGVYIYVVTMKDDRVEKGTIEIIRLKK